MNVNVMVDWMDEILKLLTAEEVKQIGDMWRYEARRGVVKLNIAEFSDASLAKLVTYLGKHADAGNRKAKLSRTAVRRWIAVKQCPDGEHKVMKLEDLEPVLKEIVKAGEHGCVFEAQPDGNMVPWFVHEIVYKPATGRGPNRTTACVEMTLVAENAGNKCVKTFRAEHLRRRSLLQVLETEGLHPETPERMARYAEERQKFEQYNRRIGLQMNVTGMADLVDGWRGAGFRGVEKAGHAVRMVVDVAPPPKPESSYPYRSEDGEGPIRSPVHAPYWSQDEDTLWEIPVHPVLHMFDLEEHALYRVHVNQVEPYVYDTDMDRRLVLPAEAKDFIRLLIGHSKDTFQDIVKGKEGGTIVMLEGPPGVGKTLTAEVYAEVMERPLYRVHSSQIGTEPEKIEAELKQVLARAERWGAILLIDEGDVFLHERGTDIIQNAVVGVFLRLLEYYRGVLFTTTNRGTAIDDAIVSRLTARFEYRLPSADEQRQLWRILGAQNGIEMSDGDIDEVVRRLPDLSGRDIKNLLKLALVGLHTADAAMPDLLVRVSRFRQTRAASHGPGSSELGHLAGRAQGRTDRANGQDQKRRKVA